MPLPNPEPPAHRSRACLGILAVAASLFAGACGDDSSPDGGETAAGTSAASSGGSGGETGGDTMATSRGDSTSASTDGATSPNSTDAAPETGEAESTGGLDLQEICTASCELLVECGLERINNCAIPCAGAAAMVVGCEAQYAAQQTCIAGLSCADAEARDEATTAAGYPCADEDNALSDCLAR